MNGTGTRRLRRPSSRGFTYAEALMTVLVILVMLGVSIPMILPRYQTYQLRSAAWQVAGDLRLARQRAVTTRNAYRFVFTSASGGANPNTYVIQYQSQGTTTWVQEIPPPPAPPRGLTPAISIDPSSTPNAGTMGFNVNGSVTPAGTIVLKVPGGQSTSVTISQAGRVAVN